MAINLNLAKPYNDRQIRNQFRLEANGGILRGRIRHNPSKKVLILIHDPKISCYKDTLDKNKNIVWFSGAGYNDENESYKEPRNRSLRDSNSRDSDIHRRCFLFYKIGKIYIYCGEVTLDTNIPIKTKYPWYGLHGNSRFIMRFPMRFNQGSKGIRAFIRAERIKNEKLKNKY